MTAKQVVQDNSAKGLGGDLSRLHAKYRKLKQVIDAGDLAHARHLFHSIEGMQSRIAPLSEAAQEAFDNLGVTIATDDVTHVRMALQSFRGELVAQVRTLAMDSTYPDGRTETFRASEAPVASCVTTRCKAEELFVEAVDQELPETATLFATDFSA